LTEARVPEDVGLQSLLCFSLLEGLSPRYGRQLEIDPATYV
jgi:hypothetical protein